MVFCVAFGCSNRSDKKEQVPGVTFHRFPKNEELRKKWTNATKRKDWEPTKWSHLCSAHFREEDLDRTSLSCVRVRQGAVPSIFPIISEIKERCPVKRRHPRDDGIVTDQVSGVSPTKKLKFEVAKLKSTVQIYQKKVKNLNLKNKRLVKKVANLNDIIRLLKEKINMQEESCIFLKSISKTSQCLVKRASAKASNPLLNKVYDDRLKAFAVTLHFLSPKAYCFVRKTFDTALPHPRTLRRWYSTVQGDPGFSTEVFRALKEYTNERKQPAVCSLMFDCMAIRKHLEWDGKQFYGTVNVGSPTDDDAAPLATEALVFNLVFIHSSWKIPLGYFFVAGVNGEQLSGLVNQCLTLLHESGITVASLTCDGTTTNIAMANRLGCKIAPDNLVCTFPHSTTKEPIHFFLDVCHMLKLVRNTLGDKKVLFDSNNAKIEWRFIEQLNAIQKEEELNLGNKLTNSHVSYFKQKMKVKLAAQVLSASVADSLQYLIDNKVKDFTGCEATIKFIRIFNKIFDILNSRSIHGKYEKQAMSSENYLTHSAVLLEAKEYISELKDNVGLSILKSRRKTGFLGFLVCIDSALAMFHHFVGEGRPLKYIPYYKVSQDHIERLFGYIRSRGGHNNNPSCRQFIGTFKRILIHSELHETNTGNSEILSKTLMFNINRYRNEIETINSSTPEWRAIDDEDQNKLISNDSPEDDDPILFHDPNTNTSDIAFDITEYIAGELALVGGTSSEPHWAEVRAGHLVVSPGPSPLSGPVWSLPLRHLNLQPAHSGRPRGFSLTRHGERTPIATFQVDNELDYSRWVKTLAAELLKQTPLDAVKFLDILGITASIPSECEPRSLSPECPSEPDTRTWAHSPPSTHHSMPRSRCHKSVETCQPLSLIITESKPDRPFRRALSYDSSPEDVVDGRFRVVDTICQLAKQSKNCFSSCNKSTSNENVHKTEDSVSKNRVKSLLKAFQVQRAVQETSSESPRHPLDIKDDGRTGRPPLPDVVKDLPPCERRSRTRTRTPTPLRLRGKSLDVLPSTEDSQVAELIARCQQADSRYVPVKDKRLLFESLGRTTSQPRFVLSSDNLSDLSDPPPVEPPRTQSLHDLSGNNVAVKEICRYFEQRGGSRGELPGRSPSPECRLRLLSGAGVGVGGGGKVLVNGGGETLQRRQAARAERRLGRLQQNVVECEQTIWRLQEQSDKLSHNSRGGNTRIQLALESRLEEERERLKKLQDEQFKARQELDTSPDHFSISAAKIRHHSNVR